MSVQNYRISQKKEMQYWAKQIGTFLNLDVFKFSASGGSRLLSP